ncbi:hypothetical protein TGPRC2_310173 [Toxoplasma gondii TgCatPRC2]|uniref:Uncharacterized protein n=1 Tax=Toxoplasma gondii TgCatPRC2 TaxID=1130821 RepID=A0A151HL11_TOXGO|nr:hypothetical protein TGPRC2_310173 [Toxoplasma gondii TgCatPRC2]
MFAQKICQHPALTDRGEGARRHTGGARWCSASFANITFADMSANSRRIATLVPDADLTQKPCVEWLSGPHHACTLPRYVSAADAHAGGTAVNLWHADFSDTHTGTATQKTCCYKRPLFWTANVSATLRGLAAAYVKQ